MVWFSDFKIQYYVPKGVSRKLADDLLEYECYRHLAECCRERSSFEPYDDEYASDLMEDAERAFKAFWKHMSVGDEEKNDCKGAIDPRVQDIDEI